MSAHPKFVTGIHAGARLDRLPPGRLHRFILFTVSAGIFFDYFDLAMAGTVSSALLDSRWSTLQLNALLMSGTGLGAGIGTILSGILADRRGRRAAFRASLFVVALATLAGAVAPSMPWLIALRFIAALGMGGVPAIGWSILAEFLPPQIRGRWVSFGATIVDFSAVAASIAAYVLLPMGGWRWMFVLPAIACLLIAWICRALPESPRWLEAQGRLEEAETILVMIERQAGPSLPLFDPHAAVDANEGRRDWRLLLQRPLLGRLLLAVGLAMAANFAAFGFTLWMPTILLAHAQGIASSLGQNLLISLGSPVGAMVGALLADRLGRRRGIISVSILIIALATAFALFQGQGAMFAVPIGFAMILFISLLTAMVLSIYVPELFPTSLRVRGVAIAMAMSRLATIWLPFLMVAMLGMYGTAGAMGLIGGCLLLVVVIMAVFGVETAGQHLEATGDALAGRPA